MAATPAELPRLAGIVIAPRGAFAIFATPGQAHATVAGKGARVGPYLVQEVGPTGVSVEGPSGLQHLRPTFDPDASRGVAAAATGRAPPSILDLLRARTAGGGLRPPGTAPGRSDNR